MLLSCEEKVSQSATRKKNNQVYTDTISYSSFIDSVEIDSEKFSAIKEKLYDEKKIAPLIVLKKADSLIKEYSESYEKTNFSYDLNKIKEGMGLHNIKSRVDVFNGKLTIDTQPERGSTFIIEIPIYEKDFL